MNAVGTLRLEGGRFVVEARPHVVLRAKRIFERIHKGSHGGFSLTDTPENAHELRWFMQRYPLQVCPFAARRLEERSTAFEARAAAVERILGDGYEAPSFELAIPARDYQRRAAALALEGGTLLLSDDVGLGKTVSAIAALTDQRTLPALVVTLPHLQLQWCRELARFAPKLHVHVLTKGTPYQVPRFFGRHPDVLVTTYHKIRGWADHLAQEIRCVVYDECQELRRTGSYKWAAAHHISRAAAFRIGLSATPIYNYGDEMWSVLTALGSDALGSLEEFQREWCVSGLGDGKKVADPRALGEYLHASGLTLRRTRSDVGRELPPVQRAVQEIDADPEALRRVESEADELARILISRAGRERGEVMRASEQLSNLLRQATGLAKAPYVAAFVRMLVDAGERVVLYGWHRAVYDVWRDRLEDLAPAMYTGSESTTAKQRQLERFLAGETPVLIVSLRAGAGLDGLQHASRTVVFGELDWSPGVHEQNIGRVARDGQKEPVVAYFLTAESGADPAMVDVLGLKKAQAEAIRDPASEIVRDLQVDPDKVRRLAMDYLQRRGHGAMERLAG